jgi:hypothetical protein
MEFFAGKGGKMGRDCQELKYPFFIAMKVEGNLKPADPSSRLSGY